VVAAEKDLALPSWSLAMLCWDVNGYPKVIHHTAPSLLGKSVLSERESTWYCSHYWPVVSAPGDGGW
jgi:hypothetical protein